MKKGIIILFLNILFCVNLFSQEKVTAINITTSSNNLYVGYSINFLINVLPINATNSNVIISLSDSSIASIIKVSNFEYDLEALNEGIEIVTVTSTDGSGVNSTFQINIDKKPVNSILLTMINSQIEVDQSILLSAAVVPFDATYKDLVWLSSDSNVLSVTNNGIITGKNIGSSLIKVYSKDNHNASDSMLFTVVKSSLYLSKLETSYNNGSDRFYQLYNDLSIPKCVKANLYKALVLAQKALNNYEFEPESSFRYADSLINKAISQTYNFVDVSESQLNFSGNDSLPQKITITSTTSWNVNSNQNWVNLNKKNGAGNDFISILPDINNTNSTRTALLTVFANGIIDTIIITQEPKYILSVSKTQFHFTTDSIVSKSLIIETDSSWTANSDVSWIHLSAQSGFGNDTIIISVDSNLGIERIGVITVISDAKTILKDLYMQTITVTQDDSKTLSMLQSESNIQISPNPVLHSFSINSQANNRVQLFSSNAQKVLDKYVIGNEIISLDGISSGVYFLKVISNFSVVSKILIVE